LVPAVAKMREQPPAAAVAAQTSPTPSSIVILPVGVPFPVAVKVTTTACPNVEGLGVSEIIVVVLLVFVAVVNWVLIAEL